MLLLWKRIKYLIVLQNKNNIFLCWSKRKVIWGKDYSLKPWEPQALPLRKWEQSINYQRKQTSFKLIKISAEIQKPYHRISPKKKPKLMNFFGTVSQHYLTFEDWPVSPTALIQFNFFATNTFPAEPESFASATDIPVNEWQ